MAHNHRENMESLLRSSTVPISVHETEEATALGHRGILLNRNEILNWNGPVPIQQYRINEDPHPELLTKSSCQPIEYNQDIQVRYLRPPTPPPAGDIIIRYVCFFDFYKCSKYFNSFLAFENVKRATIDYSTSSSTIDY